jgi:hypothetical protein
LIVRFSSADRVLPIYLDLGTIAPVAACDFCISYTSADRAWAECIAWELEEAGYTTLIQAWDLRPGINFVTEMQKETAESGRTHRSSLAPARKCSRS